MATPSEKQQQEFTDAQLQGVDAAYLEAGDNVDLQKAVDIGLITKETKSRIEDQFKDHEKFFKAAKRRILDPETGNPLVKAAKTPERKNAVAIRLAFEQVYGKFLFEETYAKGDPRHGFAEKFEEKVGHVLKVHPDKRTGIAGRSELLAARRRLMTLSAAKPEKNAANADAQRKLAEKEEELGRAEEVLASMNEVVTSGTYQEFVRDLGNINANSYDEMVSFFTKYSNDALAKLEPFFPGLTALINGCRDEFDDFHKHLERNVRVLATEQMREAHSQEPELLLNPTKTEAVKEHFLQEARQQLLNNFFENVFTKFVSRTNELFSTLTYVQGAKPALEAEIKQLKANAPGYLDLDPNEILEEAFMDEIELDTHNKESIGKIINELKRITEQNQPIGPDINNIIHALDGVVKSRNPISGLTEASSLLKDLLVKQLPSDTNQELSKCHKTIEDLILFLGQQSGGKFGPLIARERAKIQLKKSKEVQDTATECQKYFFGVKEKFRKIETANSRLNSLIKRQNDDSIDKSSPIEEVEIGNTIATITDSIESKKNLISNLGGSGNKDQSKDITDKKIKLNEEIETLNKRLKPLTTLRDACKTLFPDLLELVKNLAFLTEHNLIDTNKYKVEEIKKVLENLEAANPDNNDATAKKLTDVYTKLIGGDNNPNWFDVLVINLNDAFARKFPEFNHATEEAEKHLHAVDTAIKGNEHLSDTEAAKKIILAVVKKQHHELSLKEQHELANLILADDVERIQTTKGYSDLAQEGSEVLEKLVKEAGEHDFKWKVLKFRYQEDGKVVEPFKDLKPNDLNVWEKIEKQFDIGKLDYKGGFFLLAAMAEAFGKESLRGRSTFTIAYRNLERKLKDIIAEQIGVKKRMGESNVRKVIDEAFDKQLKASCGLMRAHFDHYNNKSEERNIAKTKELKHRIKVLNEQRRLKKIDQEQYADKIAKVTKEAKEYGIEGEIGYVQDAAMRGYANSPEAQWLKDIGADVGRYAGDKALAVVKGTALAGVHGVVGATKLGASLTWHATMTPLRLAKYPLLLAAKPVAGFINLFRTNKLTVPGIGATARKDVDRVTGYFKTKGSETAKGLQEKAGKAYGEPWAAAKFKRTKYAERSTVKLDAEAERIKELAAEAELKPLEIAQAPSIDFEALRAEITAADKQFGRESTFEKAPKVQTVSNTSDAKATGKPEEPKAEAA